MKKISSVKAGGYTVLVEMLNQQEAYGTTLSLHNTESSQGYIKSVGPLVPKDCGFQVGDRVLLQGTFVPAPNPTESNRKWGVVEMHNIKAILEEEDE